MNVLVTGAAGFIGFHVANKLIGLGHNVYGVDIVNDYYSVQLKLDRLKESGIQLSLEDQPDWVQSEKFSNYKFLKQDLSNFDSIAKIFGDNNYDQVVHLAAQPGVRYSIENPHAYIESNIVGFINILEGCRHYNVFKIIYASSSSVYGKNATIPFHESDRTDEPISLYAATKKSNELMAYTYKHLYGIETIGLRFFTVYGPWGRPDMAPMLFAKAALDNEEIKVFNHGNQSRDFTYISDIVEGICRCLEEKNNNTDIMNIGNGSPVPLMDFIGEIENVLGLKLKKQFVEAQPGDVPRTYASVEKLEQYINYTPKVGIQQGVREFMSWYRDYYQ
ncbi:MAG: NAD-dependent epimerase/dehydratase family protein [Salibacteraceae bacterium]